MTFTSALQLNYVKPVHDLKLLYFIQVVTVRLPYFVVFLLAIDVISYCCTIIVLSNKRDTDIPSQTFLICMEVLQVHFIVIFFHVLVVQSYLLVSELPLLNLVIYVGITVNGSFLFMLSISLCLSNEHLTRIKIFNIYHLNSMTEPIVSFLHVGSYIDLRYMSTCILLGVSANFKHVYNYLYTVILSRHNLNFILPSNFSYLLCCMCGEVVHFCQTELHALLEYFDARQHVWVLFVVYVCYFRSWFVQTVHYALVASASDNF